MDGARVLLLGGGGREAALAWCLARSPLCAGLWAAPGNPGLEAWARRLPDLDILDADAVAGACARLGIDLVFIGPEQPLVAGLADELAPHGIPVFGPSREAARLEGSKAWAKDFMARHHIPSARHQTFTRVEEALAFLDAAPWPVVVKASGLAAGKGVILPESLAQARACVEEMLSGRAFGEAGSEVVIEERMAGPELSVFALCDGQTGWILGSARDHKRVGDGDRGPNTGGMGALAPSPLATPALLGEVRRRILEPVLAGMAAEGCPYRGVLYLGLMLTDEGPKVIEFNCRLGDPETQALLPLLRVDLLELALLVARGGSLPAEPETCLAPGAAVCVVLAAEGYPGPAASGDRIQGLEQAAAQGTLVFLAGVQGDGHGGMRTAGGRVLGLTARAADAAEARRKALEAARKVAFRGAHYRKDIGA